MYVLWTVAAPFFAGGMGDHRWIDDFVPPGIDRFRKMPEPLGSNDTWHSRAGRGTPLAGWARTWRHSVAALAGTDGLVTVFPQLALTGAIQRDLYYRRTPIVAWCFNLGALPTGAKRAAARIALKRIERIVVHSAGEVPLLQEFLGTADGVVQFVPLQRAPIPVLAAENEVQPFIVAMGSANRDYRTLFEAARRTKLPLTVVAAQRTVEGLNAPPNVTVLSNLTAEACWELVQKARFSVVPLADVEAASGQVTVIEAMRMNRAVIATRSMGTLDYVEDGVTGVLVPPMDVETLSAAMERLWYTPAERHKLSTAASEFAEQVLSDTAAGRTLARILKEARDARS